MRMIRRLIMPSRSPVHFVSRLGSAKSDWTAGGGAGICAWAAAEVRHKAASDTRVARRVITTSIDQHSESRADAPTFLTDACRELITQSDRPLGPNGGDTMRATSQLRQLLKSGKPLFVPGCYNALSARILADVGFPAVYMTGYGTSLSLLGMPDAGLATMTEMHLNARYIANAVPVPVIADADNGYGNAINVMRTVREYIGTGVAGIHIEDQGLPKRCGHVAGRRVIAIEEAVGKYRAADAVRRELDPDFVIIARTDARGATGGSPDHALHRANAYLEAGADLAFVEGPTSVDEVRRICKEVHGPIFYNQTGVSPRFTLDEMNELGIAVTILPGATFRATIQAVYDLAKELRERGPVAEADFNERFKAHPLGNVHTFAGFDQVREWEEEYLPAEEMDKYTDSVGHQPAKS